MEPIFVAVVRNASNRDFKCFITLPAYQIRPFCLLSNLFDHSDRHFKELKIKMQRVTLSIPQLSDGGQSCFNSGGARVEFSILNIQLYLIDLVCSHESPGILQ